jgi:uncharacterized membrane protein YjjP (DUF1212 family)
MIDLPIAFILGCILGILQLIVAPRSLLYANVFEIVAAMVTSFLARAFGSINGGNLFCFPALAQSAIALILPGYVVLCASLELQSRLIVAGSVRMVYAIIYSLFLGFGITLGTAFYGLIDSNATSATQCQRPISSYWNFLFVPLFAFSLAIISQAKWRQIPVMVLLAFAGYLTSFYSSKRFSSSPEISSTLGAFVIGVLANFYSRMGHRVENWTLDVWEDHVQPRWQAMRKRIFESSTARDTPSAIEDGVAAAATAPMTRVRKIGYSLAAAAMLPAIFVQVPGGLSVNGSLVSGIASANQITGHGYISPTVVNGTSFGSPTGGLNTVIFNVAASVIQIAIGITVGLFLSAVVVYPFGKKRSGLFAF